MSVNKEVWAIYGYKGGYKDFYSQQYISDYDREEIEANMRNIIDVEEESGKKGEVTIISDGMGGSYSFFGILIDRYGKDGWYDDRDIDLSISKEEINDLDNKLKEKVKELGVDVRDLSPRLHVFCHYT